MTKLNALSTTDRRLSATFTGVYNRQCRRASRKSFRSNLTLSLSVAKTAMSKENHLVCFRGTTTNAEYKCVQTCLVSLSGPPQSLLIAGAILSKDSTILSFSNLVAPIGHLQIQAHIYVGIYWLPAMVRNTDRVPRGGSSSRWRLEKQCELLRATITLVGDGSDGLGVFFSTSNSSVSQIVVKGSFYDVLRCGSVCLAALVCRCFIVDSTGHLDCPCPNRVDPGRSRNVVT